MTKAESTTAVVSTGMTKTRRLHLESCETTALCAEAYRRLERAEQTEGNIRTVAYWRRALDNAIEKMDGYRQELDREARRHPDDVADEEAQAYADSRESTDRCVW